MPWGSDSTNPNYIESVTSLKRKTKEDIRVDQLVPSQVLEDSGDTGIKQLLEYYYKFMNMNEFIYTETQTYVDTGVASGKAVFRIPDPNNDNNKFFGAKDGSGSTLKITQANGTETSITLNSTNWFISNGNELPGSLETSTNPYGKTVTITGLTAHNGLKATLTTPQTNWVRPGHIDGLNSHNVSATVYIKDDEWDAVGEWMWMNRHYYNGLAVLPFDGGSYTQAPFEEIDKQEYDRLFSYAKLIDLTQVIETEDNTNLQGEIACAGGVCEI